MDNVSPTSNASDLVPQQNENEQRVQSVQISYSNNGINQIHDQSPGQAVQTPDGQLETSSEEQVQQQQPMEAMEAMGVISLKSFVTDLDLY